MEGRAVLWRQFSYMEHLSVGLLIQEDNLAWKVIPSLRTIACCITETQQEHQKVQQVEKRVGVYVKKECRVVMPAGM